MCPPAPGDLPAIALCAGIAVARRAWPAFARNRVFTKIKPKIDAVISNIYSTLLYLSLLVQELKVVDALIIDLSQSE